MTPGGQDFVRLPTGFFHIKRRLCSRAAVPGQRRSDLRVGAGAGLPFSAQQVRLHPAGRPVRGPARRDGRHSERYSDRGAIRRLAVVAKENGEAGKCRKRGRLISRHLEVALSGAASRPRWSALVHYIVNKILSTASINARSACLRLAYLLDAANRPSGSEAPICGCNPEPPKILSSPRRPCHERIQVQVDHLGGALERVVPVPHR